MKKLFLGLIINSVICITVNAQSKFSLGPTAGVGASWLKNPSKSDGKLAANAGLSLVYSATPHFGIGLDAKYSFEGEKTSLGTIKQTIDLNYLRLPLKAIYFFNDYGDRLRPKVFVGPSFGFLAGGKTKTDFGSSVSEVPSKNLYNTFDFGVTAGAGLNYRLVKNTWFNLDANYNHGITDIDKIANSKSRNRNVMLNVGVNFGL